MWLVEQAMVQPPQLSIELSTSAHMLLQHCAVAAPPHCSVVEQAAPLGMAMSPLVGAPPSPLPSLIAESVRSKQICAPALSVVTVQPWPSTCCAPASENVVSSSACGPGGT